MRKIAVSGTFSLGFRTKVFPQASASGNIHIGTIAGKLKGVMPTQTPNGWCIVSQSTPRARFSSVSPIRSVGMPQAYSMFSMSAISAAARFGEGLTMLAGDELADVIEVFFHQLAITKKEARALDRRCIAPGGKGRGCSFDGLVHNSSPHIGTSAMTSPREGL